MIFSKVNGTGPLGSGGHPQTILSNGRLVVSQYRDYKNRDRQSWDRQFGDYCENKITVTANIVTTFMARNIKDSHFSDCQSHDSDCKLSVWSSL